MIQAINILNNGGVIILPTETVYGIMCDASCDNAVQRIYDIKQRTRNMPLQIITHNIKAASEIADFSNVPKHIINELENSPITLVVPKKNNVNISKYACDKTIGIRIVQHPIMQDILQKFDKPIAASSANISGDKSPTNIDEISDKIINNIDYYVDGGECDYGHSSAVISCIDGDIKLLRENLKYKFDQIIKYNKPLS